MNLADADKLAGEIIATLSPYCERIQVAGSVRRRKPEGIKDVEIVAIPRSRDAGIIRALVGSKWGRPSIGAFPSKYTRIRSHVNIDFFWCDGSTFGLNLFIRTGPAEYSHRGLARWKEVSGGYSKNARLYYADGIWCETPDEEAVFRALKWPVTAPEDRR